MKRLIPTFAFILGCASAAWAAAPATLTTLRAIHALTNGDGDKRLPVAFEATVTYFRPYEKNLFVQDGDAAIYVMDSANTILVPGDRVFIKGTTAGSFNPIVISNDVTLLHHGALPTPVPASFEQLVKAQLDCLLVSVRGVVRAADIVTMTVSERTGQIQLLTEAGHVEVILEINDASKISNLLDATVEVTGVSVGKFDDKMELTGAELFVSRLSNIKILAPARTSPWSIPVTPLVKILSVYNVHDLTPRVRVQGTITYYQPGRAIVLQDGSKSLWIETTVRDPLRIGDRADVTGFTNARDRTLTLIDAEIQDSHVFAPITPQPATWQQLAAWSTNTPDGHQNDLVSIEGTVAAEVQEVTQDEYVLASDGRLFTAIYHHPPATSAVPSMMKIPLGSRIRVTGICSRTDTRSVAPGQEVPFNILLRTFDDMVVVARPSVLNIRNLILIVGLLLAVVFAVLARGWTLEHKVRRQTAAMAALEQRRSRILEDINGARPLAEIVEEIADMVSCKLNGAPCWCQIADGARLGNCPPDLTALRIVHEEIPARSGKPLGTLFAVLDPLPKPGANESEALSMGAGLATLAIETRRLYSDLLHRSDFDLLTDIHNRFSLDKHLDSLIEEARQKAGIFGLIYVDLDEFKQVNDVCGHQVGDLYLQEVALRMKRQLRSHDMLARLGGDEFAALVPVVRSRAGVEEIAQRLERSFDEPFAVEGFVLHGSASVGIALYPEDALTKDGLLSAADAAMYQAKNTKKQSGQAPVAHQNPELTPKNRA